MVVYQMQKSRIIGFVPLKKTIGFLQVCYNHTQAIILNERFRLLVALI